MDVLDGEIVGRQSRVTVYRFISYPSSPFVD
jgi:hypothetical protein